MNKMISLWLIYSTVRPGPYNPKLETSRSDLNWFVLPDPRRRIPRKLCTVLQGEEDIVRDGLEVYEVEKMVGLIRGYKTALHEEERHDFGGVWRGGETRREKLVKSLRGWLVGEDEGEDDDGNEDGEGEEKTEEKGDDGKGAKRQGEVKEGYVSLEEVLRRIREEVDLFNTGGEKMEVDADEGEGVREKVMGVKEECAGSGQDAMQEITETVVILAGIDADAGVV